MEEDLKDYFESSNFPVGVMNLGQYEPAASTLGNEAVECWVEQNIDGHQRMVSSPRRCTTPVTPSEGIDANIALQSFDRGQSPPLAASPSR
ncbi:hypothetical protein QQS21_003802, partial [Conoideocrella luteorostrata]